MSDLTELFAIEPEKLFTRVFMNLVQRDSDMATFRRLADIGMPAAIAVVHDEQLQLARDIEDNPAYDEFFKDRKAAVKFFGGPQKMAAMTASQTIKGYSKMIDAAALVFIHSAVDAAISDLCRLTAIVAPERWEKYVLDRQVSVSDVKKTKPEELIGAKIRQHVASLDRQSVKSRIERLFAVCKPAEDFAPVDKFEFDLDRVVALDLTRQDVVHGKGYKEFAGLSNSDLEFLVKTGIFLWAMVSKAFDLKLNPLYAAGIDPVQVGATLSTLGKTSTAE
jgi:hypothetical protein